LPDRRSSRPPGLSACREPDARPIKNGRLGKPVEFGPKAQVMDNQDGLILDNDGNPPDAEQFAPGGNRVHKRLDRVPEEVAADCGHSKASVDKNSKSSACRP
jgi:IS5 family transposase